MLAGGGGIEGLDGQDCWTRSGPLRRRGSNVAGGDPFDDGRAIEGWLFTVILVDVAGGCGRRRLSGCSGCCWWGGNSSGEQRSARWPP